MRRSPRDGHLAAHAVIRGRIRGSFAKRCGSTACLVRWIGTGDRWGLRSKVNERWRSAGAMRQAASQMERQNQLIARGFDVASRSNVVQKLVQRG
jgi:hypothetical protein